MDSFEAILKELRKKNKETQKTTADAIGVDQQTLRRYESGDRKPDIEILVRIADHFNVSTDYLLGRSPIQSTDTFIQNDCVVTGLSQEAVEELKYIKENRASLIAFFNKLIVNSAFQHIIGLLVTLEDTSSKCSPLLDFPDNMSILEELSNETGLSVENIKKQLIVRFCKDNNTVFYEENDNEEKKIKALDSFHYTDLLNKTIDGMRLLNDHCTISRYDIWRDIEKIMDQFDHREDYKRYNIKQFIEYLNLTPLQKESEDNGKHNKENE